MDRQYFILYYILSFVGGVVVGIIIIMLIAITAFSEAKAGELELATGPLTSKHGTAWELQARYSWNKYLYASAVAYWGFLGKQKPVFTGNSQQVVTCKTVPKHLIDPGIDRLASYNDAKLTCNRGGPTYLYHTDSQSEYYALRLGAVLPYKLAYLSPYVDLGGDTELAPYGVEAGLRYDAFNAYVTYNEKFAYTGLRLIFPLR